MAIGMETTSKTAVPPVPEDPPVPEENAGPMFFIPNPPADVTKSAPPYSTTITGTVDDLNGVVAVEAQVDVIGDWIPGSFIYEATTSPFTVDVYLPPQLGTYTVWLRAQDGLGAFSVIPIFVNVVDATGPNLTIVTPFEGDEF